MNKSTNNVEELAIYISIRHHFCNVVDNALEIYNSLQNVDDDKKLSEVVWQPFEHFSTSELTDSVENLKNDIQRTFK